MTDHTEQVIAVAFSSDGKRLVTGGSDGAARVTPLDPKEGGSRRVLTGHVGLVLAVAFSPDGSRIVTGGNDATVQIWDAARGVELLKIHDPARHAVRAVCFSPDGEVLYVGSDGDGVRAYSRRPARLPPLPVEATPLPRVPTAPIGMSPTQRRSLASNS